MTTTQQTELNFDAILDRVFDAMYDGKCIRPLTIEVNDTTDLVIAEIARYAYDANALPTYEGFVSITSIDTAALPTILAAAEAREI